MKAIRFNERGVGHLVALLVVAVVLAVGFVGWRVMNSKTTEDSAVSTSGPSKLKTKADVVKAANELEATNVDSTVNPDDLDSDINSLL
jgi:uncharacterized protein (UPF0333 family)